MKIGDSIRFKAATRDGCGTATRKVRGIDSLGRPLVGYHGWDHFIVMPAEVLEVIPA